MRSLSLLFADTFLLQGRKGTAQKKEEISLLYSSEGRREGKSRIEKEEQEEEEENSDTPELFSLRAKSPSPVLCR